MGMQISSASTASVGGASVWQQQRQNFNQLAQALKSGDLNAAKSAFAALSANSPNAANPNSPLAKIGQALQSGDVGAAQQAFSAMRGGGHHHHHHAASMGQAANAPPPLATSGSVGTIVNSVA
jgi:thioredoxin-like negative regulator of GroEL